MNELAEEAIKKEILKSEVLREEELKNIVIRLHDLRMGWAEEEIASAAIAEANFVEPTSLRVQMITRENLPQGQG